MIKQLLLTLPYAAIVLVLTAGGAVAEVAHNTPAAGFSTLQTIALCVVSVIVFGVQSLLGGGSDDDSSDGDGGGD